ALPPPRASPDVGRAAPERCHGGARSGGRRHCTARSLGFFGQPRAEPARPAAGSPHIRPHLACHWTLAGVVRPRLCLYRRRLRADQAARDGATLRLDHGPGLGPALALELAAQRVLEHCLYGGSGPAGLAALNRRPAIARDAWVA